MNSCSESCFVNGVRCISACFLGIDRATGIFRISANMISFRKLHTNESNSLIVHAVGGQVQVKETTLVAVLGQIYAFKHKLS